MYTKHKYILLKALPQACMQNADKGACQEISTA